MPWEIIGDCEGNPSEDRKWFSFVADMTTAYLRRVCGPEPDGCEISLKWSEHEMGDYAEMALLCDEGVPAPKNYLRRCEAALKTFNENVSWSKIEPWALDDRFDEIDQETWEEENSFPEDTDDFIVAQFAAEMAARLAVQPEVSPEVAELLNELNTALKRLPLPTRGVSAGFAVELRPSHFVHVSLSETTFRAKSNGYTSDAGVGSDSYTNFDYFAQAGGYSACEGEPLYDDAAAGLVEAAERITVEKSGELVSSWQRDVRPLPKKSDQQHLFDYAQENLFGAAGE